ncbi:MAG: hypothetical protein ACM3SQ_05055 [Betaproteobacteria bacterium]
MWLLIFGLFLVAGSGAVSGSWVLLLILATGGVPLILTLGTRPRRARNRSPLEPSAFDVHQWENDGGAPRAPFNDNVRQRAAS